MKWLDGFGLSDQIRDYPNVKPALQSSGIESSGRRVKCCEIFFEALNSPALCVKPQSVLALYGSGHTTGLSIDLGQNVTAINPIYEGGTITYANITTNLAGNELNDYIKDSLGKREVNLGRKPDDVVDEIRKSCVYITENCAALKTSYKKMYKLPSGRAIDVSDEAFMAGELFFQPDLVMGRKTNYLPIHEAIMTSVVKCDAELHSEMYNAIVTHGGCKINLPGFNVRLAKEVEALIHRKVRVIDCNESYAVAWLGGAIFSGITDAIKIWINKKQFEEQGERIVRNRFL